MANDGGAEPHDICGVSPGARAHAARPCDHAQPPESPDCLPCCLICSQPLHSTCLCAATDALRRLPHVRCRLASSILAAGCSCRKPSSRCPDEPELLMSWVGALAVEFDQAPSLRAACQPATLQTTATHSPALRVSILGLLVAMSGAASSLRCVGVLYDSSLALNICRIVTSLRV